MNKQGYTRVAIAIHWVMAIAIFSQIIMGLYMTSLTYYDPGYRIWPWWHKSIGICLLILLCLRIIWRRMNPPPAPLESHQRWEVTTAHLTHITLYILIGIIAITGYLISTADGRGIDFFNLFTIPATITQIPDQEDITGLIHLYLSYLLLAVIGLHLAGALKHHFMDRDTTLLRMITPNPQKKRKEHHHESN